MARPSGTKNIKTPDILWELFENYKRMVKLNPIIVIDFVGAKGQRDERPKERPLTLDGFYNYLDEEGIITDATDYFENKDDRYKDYVRVCRAIKRVIRDDQVTGGMAGIYNPSITQRLNGLVEKTSTETINREVPLFPDVSKNDSDK